VGTYLVQDSEKVLFGHVLDGAVVLAVAAAMETVEIAAQRAFPEQIGEFMQPALSPPIPAKRV
jgi:hypothetical protein